MHPVTSVVTIAGSYARATRPGAYWACRPYSPPKADTHSAEPVEEYDERTPSARTAPTVITLNRLLRGSRPAGTQPVLRFLVSVVQTSWVWLIEALLKLLPADFT